MDAQASLEGGSPLRLGTLMALADPAASAPLGRACDAAVQARQLAAALGDHHAHALAGHWACLLRHRRGQLAEVLAEAPQVLSELLGQGLATERRDLLYAVVLCACETGRFDLALESAQALGAAAMPLRAAGPSLQAALALAACLERMGDSWQAERVLAEALGAAGEPAPPRERMVALNGLCAITIGVFHRLRGVEEAAASRAVLERARSYATRALALLDLSPDPLYRATIAGNLGEVLTHLGELDAAWSLLSEALVNATERDMQAHAWRIECSIGDWLLLSARPAEAREAMAALLLRLGDGAPPQTVIRAHQAAYRACRALALHEEALQHFEAAEALERRRVTNQLRAQSQLFVTRSEVEHARLDAQHQRRRANENAERAERDALTGLGNRRLLERRAAELLPQCERDGRPLALALLDIDLFKGINDQFGHAAGDAVLVALAQLLRDNTRTGDVLARQGGEEFVMVLPGMVPERAAEVCERLRERVAANVWGPGIVVTISIGLSAAPPYDLQALLQQADAALYSAKRGGRNRLCRA